MGTAVVTGSASGIGAAVRACLARDGDRVIGVDLHNAEVETDLATPAGRSRAVIAVRDACAGALDRLVLCAGLGVHVDDSARIASVNYFGAVDLLDGLQGCLAGRPGAAVAVVCSNSAQLGPFEDHPVVHALLDHDETRTHELLANENSYVAYAGSKHALARAVRRRARDWGRAGVRLNGIAPGPTRTPLIAGAARHPVWGPTVEALEIPLGRWAEPEEIAGIITFLLSSASACVHGSIWYADGGIDAAARPDRF